MAYYMIECNNKKKKAMKKSPERKRKHVPERNEEDGEAEIIPAAVPSDGLISHEIIANVCACLMIQAPYHALSRPILVSPYISHALSFIIIIIIITTLENTSLIVTRI